MGIISSEPKTLKQEEPNCPIILMTIFEIYKEIKFIQRITEEGIRLYPREMLSWIDIAAYRDLRGVNLSMKEVEMLMMLDAIFEGRTDG